MRVPLYHVIVGFGNIGQRYYRYLRDIVQYKGVYPTNIKTVDNLAGGIPSLKDFIKLDEIASLYICSPPDSHLDYIEFACNNNIPFFCEKPVITCDEPEYQSRIGKCLDTIAKTNLKHHVSCNYRFSPLHMKEDLKFIDFSYYYTNKFNFMDFIHMVDLCWERYGDPAWGVWKRGLGGGSRGDRQMLSLYFPRPDKFVAVLADYTSTIKYGSVNGRDLSGGAWIQEMYVNQLMHWFEVLRGRVKSCNTLDKAVERTEWLKSIVCLGERG